MSHPPFGTSSVQCRKPVSVQCQSEEGSCFPEDPLQRAGRRDQRRQCPGLGRRHRSRRRPLGHGHRGRRQTAHMHRGERLRHPLVRPPLPSAGEDERGRVVAPLGCDGDRLGMRRSFLDGSCVIHPSSRMLISLIRSPYAEKTIQEPPPPPRDHACRGRPVPSISTIRSTPATRPCRRLEESPDTASPPSTTRHATTSWTTSTSRRAPRSTDCATDAPLDMASTTAYPTTKSHPEAHAWASNCGPRHR